MAAPGPWPNEESKFRKRTSSYGLHLNLAAVDEVEVEGKELFQAFLTSEIRREGLMEPEILTPYVMPDDVIPSGIPNGGDTSSRTPVSGVNSPASEFYNNPVWARTGKELRQLADTFSTTKEREEVRQKARGLSMNQEFTYDQFQDLLSTLFSRGITRERIVVLFFFCSDVAIMMLTRHMADWFQRVLRWSLRFISDKVCSWVREHGGWEAVVHGTSRYTAVACLVVAAVVLGWMWMKKRSSAS